MDMTDLEDAIRDKVDAAIESGVTLGDAISAVEIVLYSLKEQEQEED